MLAHATHLYFDHPYEPDPEERGYYWAPRFIDTRKTFGYMPDDVYANADVTRAGTPFTEKDVCGEDGSKCVPLKKTENIVGKIWRVGKVSSLKHCQRPDLWLIKLVGAYPYLYIQGPLARSPISVCISEPRCTVIKPLLGHTTGF